MVAFFETRAVRAKPTKKRGTLQKVCAILVRQTQKEVLLADSNKEFAFDKTTTATCIFYTKTVCFLVFYRGDIPSKGNDKQDSIAQLLTAS